MRARPGIGFSADTWLVFLLISFDFPYRQHVVVWLQLAMQIGFIISGEGLKVGHYRMLGLHCLCGDGIHGMAPELSSHKLYVFIGIPETIGSAMDGQKALSRCHKIQQGPLCRCRKCIPVGKNHQGIIFAQGLGIQVRQIIRVGDVDSLRAKGCH